MQIRRSRQGDIAFPVIETVSAPVLPHSLEVRLNSASGKLETSKLELHVVHEHHTRQRILFEAREALQSLLRYIRVATENYHLTQRQNLVSNETEARRAAEQADFETSLDALWNSFGI